MNIIDENKYLEFKHILSGCRTILDGYYFAEMYIKKNPEMDVMVKSMVNGKKYESILDFKTMKSTLETLDGFQYREDADKLVDINLPKTCDSNQKKSIKRIMMYKPTRPIIHKIDMIEHVTKACPHCNHQCSMPITTTYAICGYSNNRTGYDRKGCNKDWCFTCGKMLCKEWVPDQLFLEHNRFHDEKCCLTHAQENNNIYAGKYCMCINGHVNRLNNKLFNPSE